MQISPILQFAKILVWLSLSLISTSASTAAGSAHYKIGSGSIGATFYPMAKALCDVVQERTLGFTCEAVSTSGSAYNLDYLEAGELDLALSQAHLQFQASRGREPFSQPHGNIRSVALMHKEIFLIAARHGSGISELNDLKDKRVSLGNAGSGSRIIIEELLRHLGWDLSLIKIHSARSAELPQLLCAGDIDAAIYSTGHPNPIYQTLLGNCGAYLVDLWDESIARFVEARVEYIPGILPAYTYPEIVERKLGVGIQVMLSAHQDLPAEHIGKILRVLVEDREKLQIKAAIYRAIRADAPLDQPTAPYHRGALEYLKWR